MFLYGLIAASTNINAYQYQSSPSITGHNFATINAKANTASFISLMSQLSSFFTFLSAHFFQSNFIHLLFFYLQQASLMLPTLTYSLFVHSIPMILSFMCITIFPELPVAVTLHELPSFCVSSMLYPYPA